MKEHVNIPVFIPHLGCKNTCVFCNQRTISGVKEFDIDGVRDTIERALLTVSPSQTAHIAFFGGSFTGIDRELMISLLSIASEYVKAGQVKSVRCSTRPDYIDAEILDILKKYNVSVIELGLQSASDLVLCACKRGHSQNDEKKACRLIVEHGFALVGQMMIGLPASTLDDELETAKFIINSGAESVRIYPTVVFRDTELAKMTESGEYIPLTLDEAVYRSAVVMKKFIDAGVEVIRTGLCASENLLSENTYFAGPNHPAIGELVAGEIYYRIIDGKLEKFLTDQINAVNIFVPSRELSKAIGQKRTNLNRLKQKYGNTDISFLTSDKLKSYEVLIESKREENKCT